MTNTDYARQVVLHCGKTYRGKHRQVEGLIRTHTRVCNTCKINDRPARQTVKYNGPLSASALLENSCLIGQAISCMPTKTTAETKFVNRLSQECSSDLFKNSEKWNSRRNAGERLRMILKKINE
jgi:hypothetical protein